MRHRSRRAAGQLLVLVGAILGLAGCSSLPWAKTSGTRAEFRKSMAMYNRDRPGPLPCKTGYFAAADGYVLANADWAERAGLRKGDRIVSVGGVATVTQEDRRLALYRVNAGGPIRLGIDRHGEALQVALPCHDRSAEWAASKRFLSAGAAGDWDGCLKASQELPRIRGFSTAQDLGDILRCRAGQGNLSENDEAQLVYEYTRLLIREAGQARSTLDGIRGIVLGNVGYLRSGGMTTLASDLEMQLSNAGRASPPQSPPTTTTARPARSQGSAFIVRPDGLLLTAAHVVQGAKTVAVKCPDRPLLDATIETSAPSNDLAVLRVSSVNLPYVSLARPRTLRVGEPVFTVGFPVSGVLGDEPKFTDGSVSALSGVGGEATFIQTTVPVQPGNSGGALLNESGEAVGIMTASAAIRPFLAVAGTLPQNINWAVKAEYAAPLFDEPPRRPASQDRRAAIDHVLKVTCILEVTR